MKQLPANHPLHLVIGQAIWLAWLGAAYGGLSVACALAPEPAQSPFYIINIVLLVLTLAVAVVLGWAARVCWRASAVASQASDSPLARFVPRASAWLYGAAAVATVVTGLPLIAVPPCV